MVSKTISSAEMMSGAETLDVCVPIVITPLKINKKCTMAKELSGLLHQENYDRRKRKERGEISNVPIVFANRNETHQCDKFELE